MAIVCPTVTATEPHQYREQMEVVSSLSKRIHLDLMDGDFVPTKSLDVDRLWVPHGIELDLHVMFRRPMEFLDAIVKLEPNLVIIHAEAEVHHMHFAAELHRNGIKAGLCVLQDTPMENVEQILNSFDHLLIFSGHLGYHGGTADLGLVHKIAVALSKHPDLEIGWDGGVNDENIGRLVGEGVDVLNVGGFIHSNPIPQEAYAKLKAKVDAHT